MKLKKLWKILLPATAIAAVTVSLPLAFTSCSSTKNNEQKPPQTGENNVPEANPEAAKPDSNLTIQFLNNDNVVDPYKSTYIEAKVNNDNENDYDYDWFYEPKGSNKQEKINGVTGNTLNIPDEWVNEVLNETPIKVRVSLRNDPSKWNEKITNIKVADTPAKTNIDPTMQNTGFSSIGLFQRKFLEETPRTPNSQVYTTPAMKEYGEQGFKYPAYDYPYHDHTEQKFNNQLISDICMNETTEGLSGNQDGKIPRYNDSNWILEQIKKGTLKKHPAYAGICQQQIPDNLPATTTQFAIGTAMTGPINLGLYAPAGEIISLTFDQQTWDLLKQQNFIGMEIAINNNFWNCKEAKNINKRYPFIRSYFDINNSTVDDKTRTIKFGSPFGGGISIKFNSPLKVPGASPFDTSSTNLNFTVSGAVKTLLYVDGQTTKQDWEAQKQACLEGKLAPLYKRMLLILVLLYHLPELTKLTV